jgi:hypothetical protein
MKYRALTVDTSTIQQKSFNFESGVLSRLKQFSNGLVRVVISDVVVREIRNHMIVRSDKAKHKIQHGLRDAIEVGLISREQADALASGINSVAVVEGQLESFLMNIGAEILRPSVMRDRMDELVDRYFSQRPPFEAGAKQNEFRDAITLMCLEEWAKSHNRRILAVSKDADWARFAEQSDWIDTTDDLAGALNQLSADANAEAEAIGQGICAAISDSTHPLHAEFEQRLSFAIAALAPEVQYESSADAEPNLPELTLKTFKIPSDGQYFEVSVLEVGEEHIHIQVGTEVTVDASCIFDFQVWDSVDREGVSLGSYTFERTNEVLELDLIVEIGGNLANLDDIEVVDVAVEGSSTVIDFGFVEPYPDIPEDDYRDPHEEDDGDDPDGTTQPDDLPF